MDVGRELQARIDVAVAAGIEPWRIITDPGMAISVMLLSQNSSHKLQSCHNIECFQILALGSQSRVIRAVFVGRRAFSGMYLCCVVLCCTLEDIHYMLSKKLLPMSIELIHMIASRRPPGVYARKFSCGTGIGFAKSHQGNLELIRDLAHTQRQLKGCMQKQPMLAGPSRKGFLGRLTGICYSFTKSSHLTFSSPTVQP